MALQFGVLNCHTEWVYLQNPLASEFKQENRNGKDKSAMMSLKEYTQPSQGENTQYIMLRSAMFGSIILVDSCTRNRSAWTLNKGSSKAFRLYTKSCAIDCMCMARGVSVEELPAALKDAVVTEHKIARAQILTCYNPREATNSPGLPLPDENGVWKSTW